MRGTWVAVLLAAALSGCLTWSAPWYANPAKSSGRIEIREKGEDFRLEILGDGDGKFLQAFHYQGAGENPWLMTVNAETDVTSPALTVQAEALRDLAAQVPGLLETAIPLIGPFPEDGNGIEQVGWARMLFGFLNQNPGFIADLLGIMFGGAG